MKGAVKMPQEINPRLMEIYMADMPHLGGSIQCGYRPAIIVQNNVRNECSTNVIVVPMTSQPKRRMPTHVIVDTDTGIPKKSVALCEQIQTIQKTRLIRKLGEIKSSEVFANIKKAMKIALAMNDR